MRIRVLLSPEAHGALRNSGARPHGICRSCAAVDTNQAVGRPSETKRSPCCDQSYERGSPGPKKPHDVASLSLKQGDGQLAACVRFIRFPKLLGMHACATATTRRQERSDILCSQHLTSWVFPPHVSSMCVAAPGPPSVVSAMQYEDSFSFACGMMLVYVHFPPVVLQGLT